MNVDQIINVGSVASEFQTNPLSEAISNQQPAQIDKTFSDWLVDQAESLNQKAMASEAAVAGVAGGKVENLHQIILGMEKAKQSFELAVQVRNKLLEGYQEILRMQV